MLEPRDHPGTHCGPRDGAGRAGQREGHPPPCSRPGSDAENVSLVTEAPAQGNHASAALFESPDCRFDQRLLSDRPQSRTWRGPRRSDPGQHPQCGVVGAGVMAVHRGRNLQCRLPVAIRTQPPMPWPQRASGARRSRWNDSLGCGRGGVAELKPCCVRRRPSRISPAVTCDRVDRRDTGSEAEGAAPASSRSFAPMRFWLRTRPRFDQPTGRSAGAPERFAGLLLQSGALSQARGDRRASKRRPDVVTAMAYAKALAKCRSCGDAGLLVTACSFPT